MDEKYNNGHFTFLNIYLLLQYLKYNNNQTKQQNKEPELNNTVYSFLHFNKQKFRLSILERSCTQQQRYSI